MVEGVRERDQPQGHHNEVTEPGKFRREVCQCRHTYSYPNQVIMALDQELKNWQVHSAHVERQLEVAHQDNLKLHRQLREQNQEDITLGATGTTPHGQVEVGEPSRKRPNKPRQMKTAKKKAKLIKCQYCNGVNHVEEKCWKKNKKCLACGNSKHQIKDCPSKRKNAGQLEIGVPSQQGIKKFPQKQIQKKSVLPPTESNKVKTVCGYCGKNKHKESECWMKLGKCFRCGSLKHKVRECSFGNLPNQ